MITHRHAVVAAMVLAVAATAGCSTDPTGGRVDGSTPISSESVPAFSGPYATEYADAWTESASPFVHEVLRDETVSEMEWAETTTRFDDCLAQQGIEFLGFDDTGGYSFDIGPLGTADGNRIADECERDSGAFWIAYLRSQATSNPQNEDMRPLIYDCMLREGALPAGYPYDDFLRDHEDLTFPYTDPTRGEQALLACSDDPMGR